MTPDTDDPDAPDRIPRPSGLTIAVGVLGVLLAGTAVAVAGFLAGGMNVTHTAPEAVGVDTQHGQLGTFSLHDEKRMKAIGKGVVATPPTTPVATPSATPTP